MCNCVLCKICYICVKYVADDMFLKMLGEAKPSVIGRISSLDKPFKNLEVQQILCSIHSRYIGDCH